MQPTMSKTGLLLQCGWPFRNPAVPKTIANVPMRYGSAFHEMLAHLAETMAAKPVLPDASAIAEKFEMQDAAEELRKHVIDSYLTLRDWLGGRNQWELNLLPMPKGAILVEKAIAYNTATDSARLCAPVDENHVYTDVTDDEQAGTVDIAINLRKYPAKIIPARLRKTVIILDHKTGMGFDNPRDSHQLKALAVAFCRLWGGDGRAIVGINHAPRDGVPAIFADELMPDELNAHAAAIRAAFPRIGDGSLRPGTECGYCSGNAVCPAYGGSLAVLTRDLRTMTDEPVPEPLVQEAKKAMGVSGGKLDISTPRGIGNVHMILQMMDRVRDDWAERIKMRLRDDPALCGVRPDGMISVLKTVERQNLSQASIDRAYKKDPKVFTAACRKLVGVRNAKMLIDWLQEIGAIETLPREELRAVKDR